MKFYFWIFLETLYTSCLMWVRYLIDRPTATAGLSVASVFKGRMLVRVYQQLFYESMNAFRGLHSWFIARGFLLCRCLTSAAVHNKEISLDIFSFFDEGYRPETSVIFLLRAYIYPIVPHATHQHFYIASYIMTVVKGIG